MQKGGAVVAGGDKYNHKWELGIIGLLTKNNLQDASKVAGVSMNTLLRWLQQDEFKEQYKQAKQETLKQAISQLQVATTEAVATLRDIVKDAEVNPSVRVSACKAILDGAMKSAELQDLEERLTKLEKKKAV